MLRLICTLLQLYGIAIIARIILSYVEVPGHHPVGRIVASLSRLVDPPLRSIRQVIPAIPVGGIRLDLSPIVLLIAVMLIQRVICG